jgi:hypothetical protein
MSNAHWHNLLADERYNSSSMMLRDYLTLTQHTESPIQFHIFSFLSLLAALAGGRIYIDRGPVGKMKLNLGIVLIGHPAIRKSTAISVMQRFSNGLPLQYGPTDTAGQRQGIMASMLPRWQYDSLADKEEWDITESSLEALSSLDTTGILAAVPSPRVPPASELYFAASELGRLLSGQSRELIDFFNDVIDGNDLYYQLKTQAIRIKNPLINLLGATTPGSLSSILPRGVTEHGFLSRLLFVYGDKRANSNPLPKPWTKQEEHLRETMLARIDETFERVNGALTLSENAEKTYTDLYRYQPALNDIRLRAYAARRSDHVLKLSGIIALSRGADLNLIHAADVRLAHVLLMSIEGLMARAFYGLDQSPLGRTLMAVTEFLEEVEQAKKEEILHKIRHIDSHPRVQGYMQELVQTGRLHEPGGGNLALLEIEQEAAYAMTRISYRGAKGLDDYVQQAPQQQRNHLNVVRDK